MAALVQLCIAIPMLPYGDGYSFSVPQGYGLIVVMIAILAKRGWDSRGEVAMLWEY